jgi:spermidine/putrescine transport system permease protein
MAVTSAQRRRMAPFLRKHALTAYALVAFAYLFIPVLLVILFSFNNVSGRFNYSWAGFTLDSWKSVFQFAEFGGVPGLCSHSCPH